LKALVASRKPVVVWGAGSFALRLFGEDALAGCHIVAIVDRDRNKRGRPFAGFTVEAPEEALRRYPDAAVLVAAAVCDSAIAAEARKLLPGNEIVTLTPGSPQSARATVDPGESP
jgi:FlaA1/EpsC-like NDP-sugar epimerase